MNDASASALSMGREENGEPRQARNLVQTRWELGFTKKKSNVGVCGNLLKLW